MESVTLIEKGKWNWLDKDRYKQSHNTVLVMVLFFCVHLIFIFWIVTTNRNDSMLAESLKDDNSLFICDIDTWIA